jgi:hypothetical protein
MPAYKKFRIGDLFDIYPTKNYGLINSKLFATHGKVPVIVNSSRDNGVGGFVGLEPTEKGNIITFSDTTTADSIFYQPDDFIGYSHVQGVYPKQPDKWTKEALLYFAVGFRKVTAGRFDYATKFNRKIAIELKISLPVLSSGEIDFTHMIDRIRDLEAARIRDLEAYLNAAGLTDYTITADEQEAIDRLNNGKVEWCIYNVEELFGKSTRGKRLKDLDRISGDLPFVTAGEANEGISAFIGNSVDVFSKNTSTIDMFGSAKYRNYDYGADDHVAVVHTETIPKHAAIFVTSALNKAAHAGQFDYSRNFYAKDADRLYISLPTLNENPDFDFMELFIRAVQKLTIKKVFDWKDIGNASVPDTNS